ncbi:MAG: hypothetical protein MRY49_02750 [Candidatus Pacebacteria bacterium]|nr:hypothetical protein [Candidatus Paceibacterota bacterium]
MNLVFEVWEQRNSKTFKNLRAHIVVFLFAMLAFVGMAIFFSTASFSTQFTPTTKLVLRTTMVLFFLSLSVLSFLGLISTLKGIREEYRKESGLCPTCGYDWGHKEPGPCPECGKFKENMF